jgi:hypothetical protein
MREKERESERIRQPDAQCKQTFCAGYHNLLERAAYRCGENQDAILHPRGQYNPLYLYKDDPLRVI